MNLTFDDPSRLWLGLIAIPLAVLGLTWFRTMIPARRVSAILARAILLILIAGALAGARRVQETSSLATVAVVDLSDSVRVFGQSKENVIDAVRRFLETETRDRGPDDLLGIVVFDGRARAIATPSKVDVLSRPFEPAGSEGTDIASALRLAGGLIPPDATGRIALFSDGNQTDGDALEAASRLAASSPGAASAGIAVDVVPLHYHMSREVVLDSLDAPPRAASESTITLRAVLESTSQVEGTLQLLREGEPIDLNGPDEPGDGRRISLAQGRNVELLQVPLLPGPVHRFEAVFLPDRGDSGFVGDSIIANNRATAFTLTPGKGSILVVDGVSGGSSNGPGATLSNVLLDSGLSVHTIAPEAFPRNMLDLQGYDLVMLENVPAEALDTAQQEMLIAQVRDLGTGLVMIGGPDSFGAGGWHGTELADLLPVRLDLPDKIIVPEAAIMFVLDSSGSMGASVLGSIRTQQQIANESAAMAIQSLDKTDLVGAIAFNEDYRVIAPLGPNTDPDRTAAKVRSIGSGGGTTLGPALREAARQLLDAEAKLKQVIVLSDGQSTDADMLEPMAELMAAHGIRVTTIGIGDDADLATLQRVAEAGKGAFYSVINPNLLPRIFLKAVRIIRSPLVRERKEDVLVPPVGSPFTAGIQTAPPIDGLVLTRPRDQPGITMAMLTPEGDPLLAHWNVGLGQVVAFTSDAHQWTKSWLDGPLYRQFWTQLARTASRVPQDTYSELSLQPHNGVLNIALDAMDSSGRPLDLLDVQATLFHPGGGSDQITLQQTGPGRYQATAPASESGSHIVIVQPMQGGQRLTPLLGGATVGIGAELARLQPDERLLRSIADRTGGRVLDIDHPIPGQLFERSDIHPRRTSSPIWPTLLAWALFFYLVDVGTRKIAWDRFVSRRFGADVRATLLAATKTREPRSVTAIAAARRTERERDQTPHALGTEDALRVAAEAKKARLAAYQDKLNRSRERARQQSQHADKDQPPPSTTPEQPESGLLAAKRRAHQRFEEKSDE